MSAICGRPRPYWATAEAVKNASSGQERLLLAQLALGRAGAALVPILAQGRAGIEDIGRQAEAAAEF